MHGFSLSTCVRAVRSSSSIIPSSECIFQRVEYNRDNCNCWCTFSLPVINGWPMLLGMLGNANAVPFDGVFWTQMDSVPALVRRFSFRDASAEWHVESVLHVCDALTLSALQLKCACSKCQWAIRSSSLCLAHTHYTSTSLRHVIQYTFMCMCIVCTLNACSVFLYAWDFHHHL